MGSASRKKKYQKSRHSTGRLPQKIKLIFNPHSGSGLALPFFSNLFSSDKKPWLSKITHPEEHLRDILQELARHGLNPEPAMTMSAAATTAMARHCAQEKYDLVIAVGGDGTINAVVNGLAGSQTALGVIPTGTTNVFSLQMNIPTDLSGACERLAKGTTMLIDLGRVNERFFTCWTGLGFDAFVIKQTDWKLKKIIGSVAYLLAGFASLFLYPFRHVYFFVDKEKTIRRGYLLIVGNVKYYGGNMVLLPHADLQDGRLDVCLFKKRGFFSFMGYLWGWRLGALQKFLDVEYLQCKEITVFDQKQHVQIDGEYAGRIPVHIEIVPKSLKIRV